MDEKGKFTGVASPYNVVDYGNDRVLPSVAVRNNNKTVPFLYQHDPHEPIGSMLLKSTAIAMEVEGQFLLDTTDTGIPMVPNAFKAYALAKKGILKLSIGYNTLKCSYDKKGVRDLEDIDIGEVSSVTFPMNAAANFTSIKSKKEGEEVEETKAMSFQDLLKVQNASDMRWKLQDALGTSLSMVLNDATMKAEDKIKQMNDNVDQFAVAYKEIMSVIIAAKSTNAKEVDKVLETKDNKNELEIKAGKKLNKANKENLKNAMTLIQGILEDAEEPDADDEADEKQKKPMDEDPNHKSKESEMELKSIEDSLNIIKQNFNTKEIK